MNRLNLNDSLINSPLLSRIGGFNFFNFNFYMILIILNIGIKHFMLKTKY